MRVADLFGGLRTLLEELELLIAGRVPVPLAGGVEESKSLLHLRSVPAPQVGEGLLSDARGASGGGVRLHRRTVVFLGGFGNRGRIPSCVVEVVLELLDGLAVCRFG